MQQVDRVTRKVAGSNASVLILGETGTGKELIASAIHRLSHRSGGPYVRVNCGALSESLLESELFGHVRGSFTGAVANRAGRFEVADGGSIFLDEINSTTRTLQVKLLRVLQEREFERVGDTQSLTTDVRVIAASNRDLMGEVAAQRFREDLYWRLNVVSIDLPALRERRDDIPMLVSFFLEYYNEVNDRFVTHISPDVIEALQDYHWPGNVRELQNYIERAVVMSETDELTLELLPACVTSRDAVGMEPTRLGGLVATGHPGLAGVPTDAAWPTGVPGLVGGDPIAGGNPNRSPDLSSIDASTLTQFVVTRGLTEAGEEDELHPFVVDRVECELITQVLKQCNGVQTKAASRLGINRNTLHKKMKQYNLD